MAAKQESYLDQFIRGCCFLAMYSCILIMILPIIGAFDQATIWLKTGTAPPRDLFWLTAPEVCAESYGKGLKGFASKDLCRPSQIDFTEWVGMNKILNQVYDINLLVLSSLICMFILIVALKILEVRDL